MNALPPNCLNIRRETVAAVSPKTIKSVLEEATTRLIKAGCDTPQLDAELLLAHVLGQERIWLHIHLPDKLADAIGEQFFQLLQRREARQPVAYLIGHKEFFGLDFALNQHTLIPRPETESLVEKAIHLAQNRPDVRIADIGTGSGCIAIALAKHLPQASLFAVDISPQALLVAQQNAVRHQVSNQITFLPGNLLAPLTGLFDLIVSNPPYVSQAELATTAPEVQGYEPHVALLAGEDGLSVIRPLLAQAQEHLLPDGAVLIEIGATQGQAAIQLAKPHFPQAQISVDQDLAGLDRMLVIEQ